MTEKNTETPERQQPAPVRSSAWLGGRVLRSRPVIKLLTLFLPSLAVRFSPEFRQHIRLRAEYLCLKIKYRRLKLANTFMRVRHFFIMSFLRFRCLRLQFVYLLMEQYVFLCVVLHNWWCVLMPPNDPSSPTATGRDGRAQGEL